MIKFVRNAAVLGFITAATGAQAATDTTAILASLTDAGAAAAVVGAAALSVYVGIKAFKMIKTAL
jgi:hypothetical protein